MAWESSDVERSIRRYLGLMLDDSWTVRIERREIRDDDRPVAVVELGQESVLRARETITQGNVEMLYPCTISAYPALVEAEGEDASRSSKAAAMAMKSRLRRWLVFGLTVRDDDKRHWAGPFRIPLWDWADTPLTGPDRGMEDDPVDVLNVQRESVTVNAEQDPEDLRRWSVMCDFRVTMEAPGRERAVDEGRVVTEGLKGHYAPPPAGP